MYKCFVVKCENCMHHDKVSCIGVLRNYIQHETCFVLLVLIFYICTCDTRFKLELNKYIKRYVVCWKSKILYTS